MLNNINGAFRGVGGLSNEYYEALVTAAMQPYQLEIKRAKELKDTIEIKSAVYDDLETKLGNVAASVKELQNGEDSVFKKKLASSGDKAILTATASADAADATYSINVIRLAKTHRVRGNQQADSTSALGLSGTFTINGVQVTADSGDSLEDIRDAINQAVQDSLDSGALADENAFSATVIDNNLVLESKSTGTAYQLTASDDTGSVLQSLGVLDGSGAFANELQAAQDSEAIINGITVTRSTNTEITDVISGVTLNFVDAGETTLTVEPDKQSIKNSIDLFLIRINDLNKWLSSKTGVTENGDGSYTRGSLADNFGLKHLRMNLVRATFATWSSAPSSAQYTRLDQIGFELGSNLTMSLADSDALDKALESDYSNVVNLFDSIMSDLQAKLDPYTEGTDTLVDQMQESADKSLEAAQQRISRLEEQSARREELIRDQVARQFAAISSYNDTGRYLTTLMFSSFTAVG